jgi:hypothetical protein
MPQRVMHKNNAGVVHMPFAMATHSIPTPFDIGGKFLELQHSRPRDVAADLSVGLRWWGWAFGRADDGSDLTRGDPPKQFAAACFAAFQAFLRTLCVHARDPIKRNG